ncbi:MAG: hypothetical protein J5803_04005 [Desulfovibrio sp.]|nr:hypothetical protein [Desulfovibrio sp.]
MARDVIAPILLLNADQSNMAVDKKILRETGAEHVETLFSGEEAARYLARDIKRAQDSVIICNERLCDMSGKQFCDIVRLHPHFFGLPILLIVPSTGDQDQLLALGYGASTVLARPYSVQTMREALIKLSKTGQIPQELRKAQQQAKSHEFEACLINYKTILRPSKHSPVDYCKVGLQCLGQKKWNSAITAFHIALTQQVITGEAELGVALAYRDKKEKRLSEKWMKKAQGTFKQAGLWHISRTIFARLEYESTGVHNPFLMQAKKDISEAEYDKAVATLYSALAKVPHNIIAERLMDLCDTVDSPEMLFTSIQEALAKRETDFDAISASIDKDINTKIQEEKERSLRAREERTDLLSKRIAALREKEADPEAKETKILEPLGSEIPAYYYDDDDNVLHLIALPGDKKLPKGQKNKTYKLPAFSDRKVGSPKFFEIIHIVKQTWAMVRRLRPK